VPAHETIKTIKIKNIRQYRSNIMKSKIRFLSPLRMAMASAALVAVSQSVFAAPVTKVLEMNCPFPLIGDQIILASITVDYPEQVILADNPVLGPIQVDVITTVPDKARQGLAFVDATQVTGTAQSVNTFHTVVGDIDNSSVLTLEPTEIPTDESGPFDIPASGQAPAVEFNASHVGVVSLTVDDLILQMKNYKANGQVAPAPVGEFEADCLVIAGQDTTLTSFEVVGDGPVIVDGPADIDVATAPINFGTLQLGQSTTRSISITNIGDLALGINSILITGADAAAFGETNSCTTLAGNASCSVNVTFTASEDGMQNATLIIDSTDEDEPSISISLSGSGQVELLPEITVTPASLDFGTIVEGTSNSQTVTISNTGGAALTVSGAQVAGSEFVKSNDNCSLVLAGSSCAIDITYNAILGSSNGSLSITSDDAQQASLTVPLMGTGKEEDKGFILEIPLAIQGSSYLAASGGTLPLNGLIISQLNLSSGDFTGDMQLDPTSGSFEVIKGWSRYLATANIEFESVGEAVGSLVDGKLIATASAYIKVPKVTKSMFGLVNWPIGGGDNCRTKTPVTFTIESPSDQPFDTIEGGLVTGTYTLPPLENCGILTSILNLKMAGEGNTIELQMTPILD